MSFSKTNKVASRDDPQTESLRLYSATIYINAILTSQYRTRIVIYNPILLDFLQENFLEYAWLIVVFPKNLMSKTGAIPSTKQNFNAPNTDGIMRYPVATPYRIITLNVTTTVWSRTSDYDYPCLSMMKFMNDDGYTFCLVWSGFLKT